MKPEYISFWLCRDFMGYRLFRIKPRWHALHKWFGIGINSLCVLDKEVPRAWSMPAGPDSVVELRLPVEPSEQRVAKPKVTVALIPDTNFIGEYDGYHVRINRKYIGWICPQSVSDLKLSRNKTTYFDFEE